MAQLASLKREHGIELYRKIGDVVLRGVFSNDWKSVAKDGNAHPSFQALAKHPGVSFSASTLWRAVQISELLKRMPKVKESSEISVGHLRAVLGLPHERQEQLLRVVVAERLSVEATLDRAGRERPKSRRGRKAVPPLLRQLGRLERLASTSAPLKGLDEEGKKRAYEKAKELRDWAADMMKKISGSRAS